MGAFKKEKEKTSCGQKIYCFLATVCVLFIAIATTWYFVFFAKDVESLVGDCGGCHCIPDESTSFQCPGEALPSSYPEETHINAWKSQTILNPYVLNCNPFTDGFLCDTEPSLDPDLEWARLGETAVCAIHYEAEYERRGLGQESRRQEEQDAEFVFDMENDDDDGLGDNSTAVDDKEIDIALFEADTCETKDTNFYRIKTYPSRQAAELAGGFVTHVGNCGVCSSLQDLAVYTNMDSIGATSPGNFCQRQAATSFENGLSCYRNMGMTQDCAKIWADTTWNTARNCFGSCVLKSTFPQFSGGKNDTDTNSTNSGSKWYDLPATLRDIFTKSESESEEDSKDKTVKAIPSNGPAPECALNGCITCNDKESAEVFERFAGRSRRRSGLLSTVARPCSTLPNIIQHPCPDTLPLAE
jgi:hypothetical protein